MKKLRLVAIADLAMRRLRLNLYATDPFVHAAVQIACKADTTFAEIWAKGTTFTPEDKEFMESIE